MQELSARQDAIYNFIAEYQKKRGYSPSRQEIADGVNIHVSTLRNYLYSLEKMNLLQWDEKVPRSIILTHTNKRVRLNASK